MRPHGDGDGEGCLAGTGPLPARGEFIPAVPPRIQVSSPGPAMASGLGRVTKLGTLTCQRRGPRTLSSLRGWPGPAGRGLRRPSPASPRRCAPMSLLAIRVRLQSAKRTLQWQWQCQTTVERPHSQLEGSRIPQPGRQQATKIPAIDNRHAAGSSRNAAHCVERASGAAS